MIQVYLKMQYKQCFSNNSINKRQNSIKQLKSK